MELLKNVKRLSRKVIFWQRAALVLSVLALGGALALGYVGGPARVAADGPACDPNDIMPCGADSKSELTNKITGEIGTVYAHFGLSANDYGHFKDKAVVGIAKQDGTVVDDKGNAVMTDAWSIGNTHFGFATEYPIGDKTYYKSMHGTTDILASDLPVWILFDEEGTVKFAVLPSCGNPVQAKKVKSGAKCDDLIKEEVKDKKNTYRFTTDEHKFGFAEFLKFSYFFDEGDGRQLIATTESADTPVEKTFTKDAKVWVEITISLPGNQEKVIIDEACEADITVEKEKPPKEEKPKEKPPVQVLSVKKEKPAPPAALPVTGPAGLAGLFAGVSAAGAVGHHLYVRRKSRR